MVLAVDHVCGAHAPGVQKKVSSHSAGWNDVDIARSKLPFVVAWTATLAFTTTGGGGGGLLSFELPPPPPHAVNTAKKRTMRPSPAFFIAGHCSQRELGRVVHRSATESLLEAALHVPRQILGGATGESKPFTTESTACHRGRHRAKRRTLQTCSSRLTCCGVSLWRSSE